MEGDQEVEVASTSSSYSATTTTSTFRPNASRNNDDETSATSLEGDGIKVVGSNIPEESSSSSTTAASEEKVKEKAKKAKDSDSETEEAKTFECNICLDTAKDAVVSPCGHLFCWPCLHQWLETRPNRQSCPVCKAAISREKVIPLYGRGGSGQDPRSKIPPRPTPTRQETPENRFNWGGGGLNGDGAGSFHLSFGIGAFPFGFFASAFNWGNQAGANINPQIEEQEFLSKIFLWVALLFIVWLLLA